MRHLWSTENQLHLPRFSLDKLYCGFSSNRFYAHSSENLPLLPFSTQFFSHLHRYCNFLFRCVSAGRELLALFKCFAERCLHRWFYCKFVPNCSNQQRSRLLRKVALFRQTSDISGSKTEKCFGKNASGKWLSSNWANCAIGECGCASAYDVSRKAVGHSCVYFLLSLRAYMHAHSPQAWEEER